MKDTKDHATGDLFQSRQAKYRAKQEASGLRQYAYWLTPAEAQLVRIYIERMREAK